MVSVSEINRLARRVGAHLPLDASGRLRPPLRNALKAHRNQMSDGLRLRATSVRSGTINGSTLREPTPRSPIISQATGTAANPVPLPGAAPQSQAAGPASQGAATSAAAPTAGTIAPATPPATGLAGTNAPAAPPATAPAAPSTSPTAAPATDATTQQAAAAANAEAVAARYSELRQLARSMKNEAIRAWLV